MLTLTIASKTTETQTNAGPTDPACRRAPLSFTTPTDAAAAARVCERCPAAADCLLTALRIDAAHRRGEDPIGITGVCGGVWFDPDHLPHRIGAHPGRRRRTTPTRYTR